MYVLIGKKWLIQEMPTVTLTHSRTKELEENTRPADILIVAQASHEFRDCEWWKPWSFVRIDVGIHRVEEASKKSGLDWSVIVKVWWE